MEFALGRSGHGGGVKEKKRSESSAGDDDEGYPKEENAIKVQTTMPKESTKKEEVDVLESAKAEMGEVREENRRLKMCLERILKNYQTLQMQFQSIVQETKRSADKGNGSHEEPTEESELVSLSLGRVPSNPKNDEQTKKGSKQLIKDEEFIKSLDQLGGSTTEALPNPSPSNSSSDNTPIKEEAGETWPPSKALKKTRESGEDEVAQQNPAKKSRVCVRARCDTPTMNDGCQWRKYGQKIAKGNPCPRGYYRCTITPTCPVRKQVQRCAEDMSILITTYEGTHNHPLPLSATAMASTTSAAASMLLSGSSTSRTGSQMASTATATASATTTTAADFQGLNFYLSDGSKLPKQIYITNPAMSPSSLHPTITIDLTNPATSSSSSSQFGSTVLTSNYPSRNSSSPTSLNFSSSDSNNAISWNNGFLSYDISNHPYNNINFLSTINLRRQTSMENNIYIRKSNNTPHPAQHSLPDSTIAAATKVITSDPIFQSALAAALTSIIGGNEGTQNSVGEILAQKMKSGEIFPASTSTLTSTSKVNGCASSSLNHRPSNAETGSLMFLAPSLPFSSPKSASGSLGDNIDHGNN